MGCDGSSVMIPKGTVIFNQGDLGDCAYIIEQGEVEISLRHGGETIVLGRRCQGDIFGEMAIIDHTRRSATATAVEACELLLVSREQLAKRIEGTDPVLKLCLNVILKRFRDTMNQWVKADGADDGAAIDVTEGPPSDPDGPGALREIRLEQGLRCALDHREFELHYQPIVDLSGQQVAGFEALIRWQHPKRGLISPALFLPSAEANGLIVEIGRWVLNEACEALVRFNRLNSSGRKLFMSVNVSSRDIEDDGFLDHLDDVLSRHQLNPAQLKLEITENLLMDRPDIAIRILQECKARGLSIAIDDFGTGYSSLSYLHRFPIDTLKIDRSFVLGIEDGQAARQILSAIIGLARQLEMPIVAEGIEHRDQASWLLEHGCEYGQGFLFAKPLIEAAASSFLRQSTLSIDQSADHQFLPRSIA